MPSAAQAATIAGTGGSMEAVSATAGVTNFVVSLIMAASLNQLWSMINGLQLAVHMPLFNAKMPANAGFFVSFLITVATFDLLPEKVLPLIFDLPVKEPYNLAFQSCGYGNMYAVLNLGTCWILINVYIMQLLFWAFCSCFKSYFEWAD